MNFNIFVNNNSMIEIYSVHIDENNFKKIQYAIDTWHGKGELQSARTSMLELFEKYDSQDTKIDIISSNPVSKKTILFDNFFKMEEVDICELEYYAYEPCELSKLCDNILKDKIIIKKSADLNKLLNWTSNNTEELLFVKLLLKSITIKPLNTIDLSNSKLIILLKYLSNVFENYKYYNYELYKQIKITKEIRDQASGMNNFNLDFAERNKMKKKIFHSFPTGNNVKKYASK